MSDNEAPILLTLRGDAAERNMVAETLRRDGHNVVVMGPENVPSRILSPTFVLRAPAPAAVPVVSLPSSGPGWRAPASVFTPEPERNWTREQERRRRRARKGGAK